MSCTYAHSGSAFSLIPQYAGFEKFIALSTVPSAAVSVKSSTTEHGRVPCFSLQHTPAYHDPMIPSESRVSHVSLSSWL